MSTALHPEGAGLQDLTLGDICNVVTGANLGSYRERIDRFRADLQSQFSGRKVQDPLRRLLESKEVAIRGEKARTARDRATAARYQSA
ncbi:hypothetical protein COY07_03080 [Candidatus Peregrinibacteria bacterium CG_4_10_14_0_2_um_filter_43_11]|nr:MAG: hypothetical protein COY07_03080 [Candidatus Peregrinibacteria bacterium CG_4_10_14_0_2_um_filter_43_11]